jgi:hypothetical protein
MQIVTGVGVGTPGNGFIVGAGVIVVNDSCVVSGVKYVGSGVHTEITWLCSCTRGKNTQFSSAAFAR